GTAIISAYIELAIGAHSCRPQTSKLFYKQIGYISDFVMRVNLHNFEFHVFKHRNGQRTVPDLPLHTAQKSCTGRRLGSCTRTPDSVDGIWEFGLVGHWHKVFGIHFVWIPAKVTRPQQVDFVVYARTMLDVHSHHTILRVWVQRQALNVAMAVTINATVK